MCVSVCEVRVCYTNLCKHHYMIHDHDRVRAFVHFAQLCLHLYWIFIEFSTLWASLYLGGLWYGTIAIYFTYSHVYNIFFSSTSHPPTGFSLRSVFTNKSICMNDAIVKNNLSLLLFTCSVFASFIHFCYFFAFYLFIYLFLGVSFLFSSFPP